MKKRMLVPASCIMLCAGAAPAVTVTYDAPGEGFASVALFDKAGVLVRSLQYAAPVRKGRQALAWDGTDDLGRVAPPGDYAVKGIFFKDPPSLKYGMTVGRSGTPPYRTPDGKGDWGANLGPGTGIAANRDSVLMVFGCVEDNTVTGVQRVDMDGNILRRYPTFYPWDCRSGAAMDETHFYIGIFNFGDKTLEVAAYGLDEPRGKILAKLPCEPSRTQHGRWRNRIIGYTEGMALSDTTVYISVPYCDTIYAVSRADGTARAIPLPTPRGLAFHGGRLYAVSGTEVLRLAPDGKPEATIVPEGTLKAPSSLAADAAGNLYVGDSGADITREGTLAGGNRAERCGTQQIHVFDNNGQALRRIGAPGGSPLEGRFNPGGLGEISGIAVDPRGRVWVNDVATGFKRNSLWSADGQLLKQWFCRKIQHTADIVNPADPRELLSVRTVFDDSPPGIYAYAVDFDRMAWAPSWFHELTIERAYGPAEGAYTSFTHGGFPLEAAYPEKNGHWPPLHYSDNLVALNGRLYMMGTSGNGEGSIFLVTPDAPPRPVAMVGYHHINDAPGPLGERVANYDQQGPNRWMTWADLNGDGLMQQDEITLTHGHPPLAPFSRVGSGRMAPDGTIRLTMLGPGGAPVARLTPRKWLDNGAPLLDWADVEITTDNLRLPDFRGGDGTKEPRGVTVLDETEKDGIRYALLDPVKPDGLRLPGIDGDGWWASRNWRKKVGAWNADGTLRWVAGRRAPGRAQPGEMYNPMMLFGVARDCLFVSDAMSMTWLWHKDGLYVGRIFPDTGEGKMDDTGIYVELMGNHLHEHGGKVYTLVNDTACAVHEVLIPPFTPISGRAVRLTPKDAAAPWDPDGPDPARKPLYRAPRRSPGTQMAPDGNADGREKWPPTQPILLDGQKAGELRAQYDDDTLYLFLHLWTPTPWRNAGTELPLCPFVSGAYVDLCFGADWAAPQRTAVRPGDLRVILAQITSGESPEDFSQGYWPLLKDAPKGPPPVVIRSPAAEAAFARIAPVDGLQMKWKNGSYNERWKFHTTQLEVYIPLTALGITGPPAGRSIGFDAAVAIANESGDQRERAAHWGGMSEARVVDRPGSAVLLPHTWGTLLFE